MEGILTRVIDSYGLWIVLIALVSIFLVGCIKVLFAKGFAKLGSRAKPIYETLSITISLGLAALWIFVKGAWFGLPADPFTVELFIKEATLVYAAVKIIYPLYENYKLRDLVRLIGRLIKAMFVKKKKDAEKPEEETKETIVI